MTTDNVLANKKETNTMDLPADPAELLSVLAEVAAVLPACVRLQSPIPMDGGSSLNLMIAYAGEIPQRPAVTVLDPLGVPYTRPGVLHAPTYKEVMKAWTVRVAKRTYEAANTVVYAEYPSFARPLSIAMLRVNLDYVWGGEMAGYLTAARSDRLSEHSSRLVAKFGYRDGLALPKEYAPFACRLLWMNPDSLDSPLTVELPVLSDDTELGIDHGAGVAWHDAQNKWRGSSRIARHRAFDLPVGPHDAYNHLKLSALYCLADGRLTVTEDDWNAVLPIMEQSHRVRLETYNANPRYRNHAA